MEFLSEIYLMLRERKKYWLIPIIVVLILLSTLIFLSQSTGLNFIYTLF